MKKLLSLGILCASIIAAPIVAHATPVPSTINGSENLIFNFPANATTLVGATSFTYSSGTTGNTGASGDYATYVPGGTTLGGDTTINFCTGCLGGSGVGNPFDFTIDGYGTFIATTDATYTAVSTGSNSSFANILISGFFYPSGTLAGAGFLPTTADLNLVISQTGLSYAGGGTFASPSTHNPPSPTPEPSSLFLLGTGLLGGVGVIRRRFKA